MIQKALDASRTEGSNKLFILMNAANYKLAAVNSLEAPKP